LKKNVLSVLAAPILALMARGKDLIEKPKFDNLRSHFHGRGRYALRGEGRGGKPGAKLYHRLSTGHKGELPLPTRKERKYFARGYGWIEPEAKKGKAVA
jgi:hypothetical protein